MNQNSEQYTRDLIILPSYIAKGLEFDAVIVYTEKDNPYTEEEKYLFYVACTRAQHQLIVYNQNN
jgi:DNA helicase-2/ATP-dependent DNA helicase PcrA